MLVTINAKFHVVWTFEEPVAKNNKSGFSKKLSKGAHRRPDFVNFTPSFSNVQISPNFAQTLHIGASRTPT